MDPVVAPYLTRPTLRGGGVRDTSLTDFAGSYLLVFFYPADWENQEDLLELNKRQKVLKKSGCEVVACSTDSCLVHKEYCKTSLDEGGLGGVTDLPMMEDRKGELSSLLSLYDEEEGMCLRSILILDDKSIVRHVSSSSMSMDDWLDCSLTTLTMLKEAGRVEVEERGRKSSFLDRIWRGNIKIPSTPHTALRRSFSRAESLQETNSLGRKKRRSKSRGARAPSLPTSLNLGEDRSNLLADIVMSAVRQGLGVRLGCSVPLPDYSAGEVCLGQGRIQGLGKLDRGGMAVIGTRTDMLELSFPLQVRGLQATYTFGGRRVEGELKFSYNSLKYRVRLSQRVGSEIADTMELVDLELEGVEGGKMEVHGFGPLNWLAGKKVSDLVQETVLQEVELELRQGLEEQINKLAVYFQAIEKESPGLVPIGVVSQGCLLSAM